MLLKKINAINDNAHYFTKPSIHYDSYMHSLNKILNSLQEKIGERKINRLIRDKLQVRAGAFDENQYIQAACELTVIGEFISLPEARFI